MSNVITMYECGRCGEVHRSEYSAEECCPTEVFEVFACADCDEIHASPEEAVACCGGEEEAPPINPRELEAAGQLNWLREVSA